MVFSSFYYGQLIVQRRNPMNPEGSCLQAFACDGGISGEIERKGSDESTKWAREEGEEEELCAEAKVV